MPPHHDGMADLDGIVMVLYVPWYDRGHSMFSNDNDASVCFSILHCSFKNDISKVYAGDENRSATHMDRKLGTT